MTGSSRGRLAALIVVLAATVPYLRTVSDYFVQDDFGGMQLLASKPWHTFPRWFTMPWMEFIWGYTPDEIRPFTALSYQITAWGSGTITEGHHLVNIAVHAANGLLVMAIARTALPLTLAGATVAAVAFVLLPMGAESVAWITGRVDSLPAFFYLLSFLTFVRWRQRRGTAAYVWAVVWFFVALFSKQNTITMVAAIALFDWLVLRRPIRLSWAWIRPYVPFAALTLAFLGLRYLILGEALRESQLSAHRFGEFGGLVFRHLRRMIWGDLGPVPEWLQWFAAIYALAAVIALVLAEPAVRKMAARGALYFGLVWIALGLAPTVAAGYESPRHAYLAAPGWTILVGLAFDLLRRLPWGSIRGDTGPRVWRAVVSLATIAILILCAVRLHREISDWRLRAAVAHSAVLELERQVLDAPEGTLFLVGVPVSSWEWATPFVARPPYASRDLTARAAIVVPERLHCCRGRWWDTETRAALEGWRRNDAGIVALHTSATGEIRRLTDTEAPELRTLIASLLEIRSTENLDGAVQDILRKLVAGRGRVISPALSTSGARPERARLASAGPFVRRGKARTQ